MRSVSSVAFSLELEDYEGGCRSSLLCFLFFLSFYALPLSSSSMVKPPESLPSFRSYAKVSLPFLQLAMFPFFESSKKPEEQKEEVSPQEANTGFPFSLLFFFFFTASHFFFF